MHSNERRQMKDAPEEVIGARALSSLSFSPFRAFVGHYFLPLPFKRLLRSLVPWRTLFGSVVRVKSGRERETLGDVTAHGRVQE